jgi:hypothetical protein
MPSESSDDDGLFGAQIFSHQCAYEDGERYIVLPFFANMPRSIGRKDVRERLFEGHNTVTSVSNEDQLCRESPVS